mmetsp:Transcript_11872/g.43432  ORF Transcript_11872/g.43432 Transcript_11872/m.43432 type:complete len:234 (+) Transcript_11872:2656-3357(+)
MCAFKRYSKYESIPAPIPPLLLIHAPVSTLMVVPKRSCLDRNFHRARSPPIAFTSNRLSPVKRESALNSKTNVPTLDVDVSVVSFGRRPSLKFTQLYGIPVGDANAGKSRSPRSYARCSNSPLYLNASSVSDFSLCSFWPAFPADIERPLPLSACLGCSCACSLSQDPRLAAIRCADKRPPRRRMLVSKTLTRTSASKLVFSMTSWTPFKNSVKLPKTANVESDSISESASPS